MLTACGGGGGGGGFAGIGGLSGGGGTDTGNGNGSSEQPAQTTHAVGGETAGIPGLGMVLQLNGTQEATVEPGGVFRFSTPLPKGSTYSVAVKKQPVDIRQNCSVEGGRGIVGDDDIKLSVQCSTSPARFAYLSYSRYAGVAQTGPLPREIIPYAIDPVTGALTRKTSIQVPATDIYDMIYAAQSGQFVYLSRVKFDPADPVQSQASLSLYTVDYSNGSLNERPGSPFDPAGQAAPARLTVHPSGRFAYALGSIEDSTHPSTQTSGIKTYRIDPVSGVLTLTGAAQATTGFMSQVDPSGRFIYVSDGDTATSTFQTTVFSIDPDTGALTMTGTMDGAIGAVGIGGLQFEPSGRFAYGYLRTDFSSPSDPSHPTYLTVFRVDSMTGMLIPIGEQTMLSLHKFGWILGFHPNGRFAYVRIINQMPTPTTSTWSVTFQVATVDPNTGALTLVGEPLTSSEPNFFSSFYIDPTGRFAYHPDVETEDGEYKYGLVVRTLDSTTGTLGEGIFQPLFDVNDPNYPGSMLMASLAFFVR